MNAQASSPSPLSVPLFRRIWFWSIISNLGTMIQSVSAGWLMTTMSPSSVMVALVQASANLPTLLLALLAGAIADNYDRRRVILCAQTAMLMCAIVLAALSWTGAITPLSLLVLTFAISCGNAINWPAMQVSMASMVPREIVGKSVALNGMAMNIARGVGPAIGGFIVASAGVAAAFVINALSFIGLIISLLGWRHVPAKRRLERESLGRAMASGLRYGLLSPVTGRVLVRGLAYGSAASAAQALLPLLVKNMLHGDAFTFGLMLGAFGVGAIAAAMSSARMRSQWSPEVIVRNACLVAAVGNVLAGLSSNIAVCAIAMSLAGASWLIVLSTFNLSIQLSAPAWVVARALSLYQMGVYGGVAFGSWAFGLLAMRIGIELTLFTASAGLLVVAVIGFWAPMTTRSTSDVELRQGWEIPETAVPVAGTSGPVVVEVEYQVAEADIGGFASLMYARSRILRRDGARLWSLSRDLANNEIWIERYRLPTWNDYLRLNFRRTQGDLAIQEQINSLLKSGTGLKVRRLLERPVQVAPTDWDQVGTADS